MSVRPAWIDKKLSDCECCGAEYHKRKREQRFCSKPCGATKGHESHDMRKSNNPNWKGGKAPLFCAECGVVFEVPFKRALTARFCSMVCANKLQSRIPYLKGPQVSRVTRPCGQCSTPMTLLPSSRQVCCSVKCRRVFQRAKMVENGTAHSRAKGGRRADLDNRYFRSSWEANYARYLNLIQSKGLILGWEYEVETFWFGTIRRGARSYTPDFKITLKDGSHYFVEIKGWMDKKSKTRLKRMAKYHPAVDLRVVAKTEYRELATKLGGAILNWEKAA